MRKILLVILFTFSIQSAFTAETKSYFKIDYGLGRFKSEKLDALEANPTGPGFGFAFGSRINYIEVGLFYKTGSYKADIIHDGAANKIVHDQKSFGVEMNVYLNKHFSLKLGYAVHSYDQKLQTNLSTSAMNSVNILYGLEKDKKTSDFFYGANLDFFGTKSFDFYTSIVQMPIGDGKSALSAQLGIRLYMDSSFADFFGD